VVELQAEIVDLRHQLVVRASRNVAAVTGRITDSGPADPRLFAAQTAKLGRGDQPCLAVAHDAGIVSLEILKDGAQLAAGRITVGQCTGASGLSPPLGLFWNENSRIVP
jgi:hypothetical protein